MKLIIVNDSSDSRSYASGTVTISADSSLEVLSKYWFSLCNDLTFLSDLSQRNIHLTDGINRISGEENGDYLKSLLAYNTTVSDSEGSSVVRLKQAPIGWSYQAHCMELTTSTLNSVYSKDSAGDDYGFCTLKLYNNSNELITSAENETQCIETVLDWEPTHDFELVSGRLYIDNSNLTDDIRMWAIGAPDISAGSGGSKIFVSGLNLKYVDGYQPVVTDGRVSKRFNYNATYHSNKMRFVFKHSAGTKLGILLMMELYKS